MRNAFAKKITELAGQDPRVVLLSGDIGNRLFDNLKAKCPERFFNCGVAEANMIGVAAGMAMSGLRPFCYTIAPFITYRCMEQIRVDVCYHHLPVVIVGTGAGLSYAGLGATHHSCEDMGMLRLLPGLAVVAPADDREVRGALAAALSYPGPVYIRIGKKGEPSVHAAEPEFVIGKAIAMREGKDVCLLGAGTMMPVVLAAAEKLGQQGVSAYVASFHTIKPLDVKLLGEVFAKFKLVATVEEHSVLGGLGGSIAEWKAEAGAAGKLLRFGCADEFVHETCEQEEAREHFGLTADAIAGRIGQWLT
jgi:transketolase